METKSSLITKTLQTLDPARIGEINLLLDALSNSSRTRELTCRVISEMAARCDQHIQPELYIYLGLELGIIQEKDSLLTLTNLGKSLLSTSNWPPYDVFNERQLELILPELLGHPDIIVLVVSTLRIMKWIQGPSMYIFPKHTQLGQERYLAFQLLQFTGFANVNADYIYLTRSNYQKLNRMLDLNYYLTRSEEDLWLSLKEANLRARTAENYVVEYERQRLKAEGRNDLSEFIERVSENDVAAGYDLRSFEADGNIRYIEVKSSTNRYVQFFWTSAERAFAQEHRNAYWIYFVPRAQDLPDLKYEITRILDPIGCETKSLSLEPATYLVKLMTNTTA